MGATLEDMEVEEMEMGSLEPEKAMESLGVPWRALESHLNPIKLIQGKQPFSPPILVN